MKKLIFLVLLLLCGCHVSVVAQTETSPAIQQTFSAIKNSDVESWIKVAAPRIWINLNNENKSYSRQQAAMVLKEFFSDNKVTHFSHGVTQTGQNTVIVGEISTASNRKYHLVCKLKGSGNDQKIVEISITAL